MVFSVMKYQAICHYRSLCRNVDNFILSVCRYIPIYDSVMFCCLTVDDNIYTKCRHEPQYTRLANWEGIKKVCFVLSLNIFLIYWTASALLFTDEWNSWTLELLTFLEPNDLLANSSVFCCLVLAKFMLFGIESSLN